MDSRMRLVAGALTVGVAALLSGSRVAAQERAAPSSEPTPWPAPRSYPLTDWRLLAWPDPDGERPTRWYGWQALIPGTASQVLLGASFVAWYHGNSAGIRPYVAGLFANPVGPAIVHWAHGQQGKAWASFGIQTGATVAALVLQVALPCGGAGACEAGSRQTALGLEGASLAIPAIALAIDAVFLAHEPASTKGPPADNGRTLVPTLVPPSGAANRGLGRAPGLGLAGSF